MLGVFPCLIRAYCSWIEDNSLTPYLLVNSASAGVVIPKELDSNGQLVLNISSSATADRNISNDKISFKARFKANLKKSLFLVMLYYLFMLRKMAKV